MERKTTKILKYVCDRVREWQMRPFIIDSLKREHGNMFNTFYVKTIPPKSDKMFKQSKAKYWTLCFLRLCPKKALDDSGYYTDDVYLFFCDTEEGIYKQALKKGEYRISYFTPCVFGSNKMNMIDGSIQCRFDSNSDNDTLYVNVDWITGKQLDFKPSDLDGIKKTMQNVMNDDRLKSLASKLLGQINTEIDSNSLKVTVETKNNSKEKADITEVFEFDPIENKLKPLDKKSKKKYANGLSTTEISDMFTELMSRVSTDDLKSSEPFIVEMPTGNGHRVISEFKKYNIDALMDKLNETSAILSATPILSLETPTESPLLIESPKNIPSVTFPESISPITSPESTSPITSPKSISPITSPKSISPINETKYPQEYLYEEDSVVKDDDCVEYGNDSLLIHPQLFIKELPVRKDIFDIQSCNERFDLLPSEIVD